MIFTKNEQLKSLEMNQEWDNAINLLKTESILNPDNTNNKLRFICECWYVLSEWEFINNKNLDYQSIQSELVNAYNNISLNNDMKSNEMAILGYIISMNPDLFMTEQNDDLYLALERQGKALLESAYNLDKNNPFTKTLFLGSQKSNKKYIKAKEELSTILPSLFSDDSAIEKYFIEVLATCPENSF